MSLFGAIDTNGNVLSTTSSTKKMKLLASGRQGKPQMEEEKIWCEEEPKKRKLERKKRLSETKQPRSRK